MKKVFLTTLLLLLFLFTPKLVLAQEASDSAQSAFQPDEFYRGKVIAIIGDKTEETNGYKREIQEVVVRITDGPDKGKDITLEHGIMYTLTQSKKVKVGNEVVLNKSSVLGNYSYQIIDDYRLNSLLSLLLIFFGLVVVFGHKQGISSILGLAVTIAVMTLYVVPSIIKDKNPFFTSLIGSFIIAIISLLLAHGTRRRTIIALVSTLITLVISAVAAILAVNLTKLSGVGSEEAFLLQVGPLETLNLKGLLLGGIIIGTLGVLDDITTAQSATVEEISKADPSLDLAELYKRGISVGKEHIASLVNTLFLAYAGASLPLFLVFSINKSQPLWVTLNSEFIIEEIVRTVVGSSALIVAVPITTFLAAAYFSKYKRYDKDSHSHSHHH